MLTCPVCRVAYPSGTRVCPADGSSLVRTDGNTAEASSRAADATSPPAGAPAARAGASPRTEDAPDRAPHGSAAPARAPVPIADSLVGATIAGRYEVVRKIGEGGMGAVYEGRHTVIGKRVAIKILLEKFREKRDLVARLLQEARLASSIGHENIIDVTDFGTTDDGRSFVVMELLDGESLAQLVMREAPLPVERTLRIGRQVASALSAAHAKGVLHRDVKPENVFLIRRGEADFVKVVDFGISKAVRPGEDEAMDARLTHTGMVLGTPLYMSPEQARGEENLDERADIWAVGVMLYECLTGEVPFRAPNYLGIIAQVQTHTPPPPSLLRPELGIPQAVESVVLHAMDKDRARRYQTMADLERDLERLLAGDQSVGAGGVAAPPEPPTGRWPIVVGAAAISLGVFGVWALLRAPELPAPPKAAVVDVPPVPVSTAPVPLPPAVIPSPGSGPARSGVTGEAAVAKRAALPRGGKSRMAQGRPSDPTPVPIPDRNDGTTSTKAGETVQTPESVYGTKIR